ncbi:hypothetical protein [Streptomyces bambusae]|uniref:WD40 repeat domain-containing protein n=1 Tax=Streptomyces bambusae TaxID=1550616 RepID=A0ABS6ZAQ9_9ACTN|nr:hypothetical protein [Streptomyces bambusae]MBW5484826.1 hypothetical protein [Streptomyces bambusae]
MKALTVAPDGTWTASAGEDAALRVWARRSGQAAAAMRTEGALFACAWSPDGRAIATGGERGLYVYGFRPGLDQ